MCGLATSVALERAPSYSANAPRVLFKLPRPTRIAFYSDRFTRSDINRDPDMSSTTDTTSPEDKLVSILSSMGNVGIALALAAVPVAVGIAIYITRMGTQAKIDGLKAEIDRLKATIDDNLAKAELNAPNSKMNTRPFLQRPIRNMPNSMRNTGTFSAVVPRSRPIARRSSRSQKRLQRN